MSKKLCSLSFVKLFVKFILKKNDMLLKLFLFYLIKRKIERDN